MITILSRFRKNEIEKKKLSFYFFYAIGEIILIVIGILLALQIDNWNHQKNLREKEAVFLEEIQQSLHNDLGLIEFVFDHNRKKDSAISAGINLLGSEMDNSKRAEEFMRLLYTIGHFEVFRPKFVAFDNLVSTESIDLIKDETLREKLSEYYANKEKYDLDTQVRVKDKTRQFLDYVMPVFMSNEIAAAIYGQNLDFQYGSIAENEFHKDPRVFYELFMMKQNISDQNFELEGYESQINELLKLIKLNRKTIH